MNKELLFQLYAIHSPSGIEKKMRRFLRKMAKSYGATSVITDKYGNLLITKGESDTYPCLAAHMDQVQDIHSKDFTCGEIAGEVIGWSPKCHEQQGLGADDKNGIFVCLELLKQFDVMKVAFFVGEEVGCDGSSNVDLQFFSDCRFIIEPDRKGGSDLITSMFCGPVCSFDFIDAIGYENYGYAPECGSITDVGELVNRGVGISCLNLSCGYYNAHTDNETTVLSELENCLNFVAHIVTTCTDVYPFVMTDHSYGGYNRNNEIEYYENGYYDADYERMADYLKSMPSISKNDIIGCYSYCFEASWFFLKQNELEDILSEIYDDVQAQLCEEEEEEDDYLPFLAQKAV